MQVLAVDVQSGLNSAVSNVLTFVPKLLLFIVILVVGIFVAAFVEKGLAKVLQRVGFDDVVERGGVKQALSKSKYDAAGILAKIVYYFIFLLVLSAAFGVFGPNNPVSQFLREIIAFLPKLFVAILALVIAAAIAAAVKDLLSNMLGGLSYGNALANAASAAIIVLGVFFALGQLGIAPLIVGGVFYALLALIVIPPIISFGVGGIQPAREMILEYRAKAKEKAQEVKAQAQSSSGDSGGAVTSGSDQPAVSGGSTATTSTTTTTAPPAAPAIPRGPARVRRAALPTDQPRPQG